MPDLDLNLASELAYRLGPKDLASAPPLALTLVLLGLLDIANCRMVVLQQRLDRLRGLRLVL